ncbi:POL1 protein, partial [Dicrurus megarhynchus]|nr:POL1 protein [Dicrurus megarhynchus]
QPKITRVASRPVQGITLYTDASSSTSTAAVVWKEEQQWRKVVETDLSLSVQMLEARAMVLAMILFVDVPCNIVTDSIFVYGLVQKMYYAGWAGTPAALMLEHALQQRKAPCFVIKVTSHTSSDKGLFLGNRKADEAAKGLWTLQEARRLHQELHLGAQALAKHCKIPKTQARQVVATCPYCQR